MVLTKIEEMEKIKEILSTYIVIYALVDKEYDLYINEVNDTFDLVKYKNPDEDYKLVFRAGLKIEVYDYVDHFSFNLELPDSYNKIVKKLKPLIKKYDARESFDYGVNTGTNYFSIMTVEVDKNGKEYQAIEELFKAISCYLH